MAREASVIVGSGIGPLKQAVTTNETTHEKHLRGTSVVVLNPEDGSAHGSGLASSLTLGTLAIKLPSVGMPYRRAMSIMNNDGSNKVIYIGFDPSLNSGNGWPIAAGGSISLEINAEVVVYGITAGSNIDVRILELS